MIRRSTVVYLFLLLVLAGAYYYLNNRENPAESDVPTESAVEDAPVYLFTAEEGIPTSIRIEANAGETVEVRRGEENAWELVQPREAAADQAAAEAAATQVTTMRILDSVPDLDPSIIGLEDPDYVLTVTFTGGAARTVDLGTLTPSESGYYARQNGDVVIVSRSAIEALLNLLTNPPYLETPAPGALETTTPPLGTATP